MGAFPLWTDFRPRDGVHRADRPVGQLVYPSQQGLMAVLLAEPATGATPYCSGCSSDRAMDRHRRRVAPTCLRSLYGAPHHVGCHTSRSMRLHR
jgi:hypothetical protein